ncbi:MAG: hypothetical protein ACXWDO_04285 [Bacteroidia bacterium]
MNKNIPKPIQISNEKKIRSVITTNKNYYNGKAVSKEKQENSIIKPNPMAYWSLALFLIGLSMAFVPYFGALVTLNAIFFFIFLFGSFILSKNAMKKIAESDNPRGYYLAKFVSIFSLIILTMYILLFLLSLSA